MGADFECDKCGEVWEVDFKCAQCSSGHELVTVRRPVVMWSYSDEDPETELVEEYVSANVCCNCCAGHATPTAARAAGE